MPKFAANLTMLFNEVDFLDRFGAAARAGFTGVEYLFPYTYPKEQLAEMLARHDLVQVLHNLPAGDWAVMRIVTGDSKSIASSESAAAAISSCFGASCKTSLKICVTTSESHM